MTKLNILYKLSLLENNYAAILGVVQDRFKLNENKVGEQQRDADKVF